MTINLSGDVDNFMFAKLLRAYSQIENVGTEKLILYISTPEGGDTDAAEAIVHFINSHSDRIETIFYGQVFSAGMWMFLRLKCINNILPDTVGMYHFAWQDLKITEGGQGVEGFDKFSMKEMKKQKARTIEFLKTTSLTDSEVNAIKKGKDVYLSNERMLQILNGKK